MGSTVSAEKAKTEMETESITINPNALKITVLYCGGWGYKPKFQKLKSDLEQEFGLDVLHIVGEKTPSRTGWFEVTLEDGTVVHSKKNGDGHVKPAQLEKIIEEIKEALAKKEKGKGEKTDPEVIAA